MISTDNDCLLARFAQVSRDLTPVSLTHSLVVLHAPVSSDPEMTDRCASVLSDAELLRASRFAARGERALFMQRRAFRRYCGALAAGSSKPLSQIAFSEAENGRPLLPILPETRFSFSSCRLGFLAAWSSTHAVGVDFEDQTRTFETADVARRYYSASEVAAVENAGGLAGRRLFFQFWCLKEAALKSIGRGLPFGMDAFEFELEPALAAVRTPAEYGAPERFTARLVDGTDGCAAVVIRSLY